MCGKTEKPYCEEYEEGKNPNIPKKGCQEWFDGCNDCTFNPTTKDYLDCSKLSCKEEAKRKPYCKKWQAGFGDKTRSTDGGDGEKEKETSSNAIVLYASILLACTSLISYV